MFNNDVTQTYNQQDASLEILIMLAGAFILGCLLCWLIKKLIGFNKQATINEVTTTTTTTNLANTTNHGQSTTPHSLTSSNRSQAHVVTKDNATTNYSTPRIDDLTKISGINTGVEDELRQRGIKSYIDLRDSDKKSIIETLDTTNAKNVSAKEAQTWPHQASLAAKGEWEKLNEYQAFMSRTKKAAEKIKQQSQNEKSKLSEIGNDLKMIEGIGPKIEELLNKNGIHTFKDLRMADRDTLKTYLDSAGSRFKMHEPQSWPHQAGMAERGEWEELRIYQEFMDGGREIPSASASSQLETPAPSLHVKNTSKKASEKASTKNNDDFKKIEGIGPKIQELLNKAGINTYHDLKDTKSSFIKKLLDEAGPQYRMHDPETWPSQAKMAHEGEWEKLEAYQDKLISGRR